MAALTITINTSAVMQSVKQDTFMSSLAERQPDGSNSSKTYIEAAGDEAGDEAKLKRTFVGALGSLESHLVDYADGSSDEAISDSVSDTSTTITLQVTTRFSKGTATVVAKLAQEYLINKMICLWWAAIPDRKNDVSSYLQLANEALANIHRCLFKKAPSTSDVSYSSVTGSIS
jgi:hypothetical protein